VRLQLASIFASVVFEGIYCGFNNITCWWFLGLTGTAKLIACIEDPVIIKKILTYLEEKLPTRAVHLLPDSRAPPQSSLFG